MQLDSCPQSPFRKGFLTITEVISLSFGLLSLFLTPYPLWGYFDILGDARQSALGGPFPSIVDSPQAVFINPALLGGLEKKQLWVGGPFSQLYSGVDLFYFDPDQNQVKKDKLGVSYYSLVIPFPKRNTAVGLGSYSFDSQNYRESSYALSLLLPIALDAFSSKWSIGLGAKRAAWEIEENRYVRDNPLLRSSRQRGSWLFSIGFFARGPLEPDLGGFRMGLVVDKIETKKSANLMGGASGPVIRWSGTWVRNFNSLWSVSSHVGYDKSMYGKLFSSKRSSYHLGGEMSYLPFPFDVRLGTNLDWMGTGVGVELGRNRGFSFSIDIAYLWPFSESDRTLQGVHSLFLDISAAF